MPLSAHTEPAEEIYAPPPPTPPREWTLEPQVIQHFMAANGVSYCVARLKSTVMDNWFGRGKFYDLRNVINADSEELRARLARHPTVCLLLNKDPRIARLIRVCPLAENTAWWVINDWIEGKTLEDILTSGIPISKPSIKHIGMELLLGLQSLHSVEIIFRELAPERVYVSDNLENCVLTDFELAKIIQGALSVAGGWKLISKYRAPEITSRGEFSYSWDFYSWSIIMDELIAAQCEDGVETVEQFIADADVFKLINECRDLNPGHRPTCVADVISVWSNWKFECQTMADWTI